MDKNPNKYGVGDVLRDILASASPGERTTIGQAKRAGIPEAAFQSPDVFKLMLSERGRTERGEIEDPYKMGALDLRKKGLELEAEKLELAREKAKADAAYKDKMLGYKKDWLSMSISERAKTDKAFGSLSQAAIKAMTLKERTPQDEALIMSWRTALAEQGYDIEDVAEDPGFFAKLKARFSDTITPKKESAPAPASAPAAKPAKAPAPKTGKIRVKRKSDGKEGMVSPGFDKTKYEAI